jgi:hypothetical protein
MRNNQYRELYAIEDLPVFQNRMFRSELEAKNCSKGHLVLVQDENTGLIYNRSFDANLMDYDGDYQNEQAVSSIFQDHLNQVKDIVHKHFKNYSLIEVGCGKGYFLEMLRSSGFQITGFDPTYESSNPAIFKKYFNEEADIRAEALILRHVLEHVEDPIEFCSTMNQTNGGGKVYIEVPCFDWILEKRAWFDIFYEHVNYFRLSDFYRIFGKVYESGHLFGGQYLYVVADLASVRVPRVEVSDAIQFPIDFLKTIEEYKSKLKQNSPISQVAIWGGASKGVIFSLLMQRAGVTIDIVVDINPAKQGRYLPSTGIRVFSPCEALEILPPGSDIIVMNSNYLSEVIEITHNKFNYLVIDNG